MIEVMMLIPEYDNNGKPFPQTTFESFERQALSYFGGFTRVPDTVRGAWVDDTTGKLYADTLRVYSVGVASLLSSSPQFLALAEYVKCVFEQEAVCLRFANQLEIL